VHLAELIATQHDALVAEFGRRARRLIEADGLSRVELLDSIPFFLDELVEALATGERTASRASPAEHAAERLGQGFHVHEVVREYFLIAQIILDAAETSERWPSPTELFILMSSIGEGAATAATEYMNRREMELVRREATHAGFLAHELRNWLATSRFAFDVLRRREFSDPDELVQVLDQSLRRASQQLDDSLLGQRLRGANVAPAQLNLRNLVGEVVSEVRVQAQEKRLATMLAIDEALEVEADPRLLRSALTNLVRNAIKFTGPGGRIELRANAGSGELVMEVADQCGGLEPGAAERMFAPFVQGSEDRSGFGLGLPIARAALEAQGGTLTAQDRPGIGCVFRMTLPQPLRPPAR
jgi:signal transduction histidine kinase